MKKTEPMEDFEENSHKQIRSVNINLFSIVLSVCIALIGGLASYYNALSQIEKSIQASNEKTRLEAQQVYVTKAEFILIKEAITRMDANVETTRKEISEMNRRLK